MKKILALVLGLSIGLAGVSFADQISTQPASSGNAAASTSAPVTKTKKPLKKHHHRKHKKASTASK